MLVKKALFMLYSLLDLRKAPCRTLKIRKECPYAKLLQRRKL